jgi:thioredoxin reductase
MSFLSSPPRVSDRVIDVGIVGGSFAGLSAALYLARARRSVAVFDNGLTRNRFADAGHGFLGQDGRAPDAIRLTARKDVMAYPTVSLFEDTVESIDMHDGFFALRSREHSPLTVTRLILAFGMADVLPAIPGLQECWGRSAMQCPYCHGYELADRPTGLLMTGEATLHQAMLIPEWADDLLLFSNGHAIDDEQRHALATRGIAIVDGVVSEVEYRDGAMSAIILDSGRRIAREVLYLATSARPSCDLADQLGCRMEDGPFGPFIQVNDKQETSVPRVYAAGDITRAAYGSTFAAADGVRAGVACHRSLIGATVPQRATGT